MKNRLNKKFFLLALPVLIPGLMSCSSSSSDSDDGKTYAFEVDFYDDSVTPNLVGYDYVAYGQSSNTVRTYEGQTAYSYKSKKEESPNAGYYYSFSKWTGIYESVDTNLPAYKYKNHDAPEVGSSVDMTSIKGDCKVYANFEEKQIQFQILFFNGGISIKDNNGNPFGYGTKYNFFSESVAMPTNKPTKNVSYGYSSEFVGYSFKENALKPFEDLSKSIFVYGDGDPSIKDSFESSNGNITLSSLPSGSLYEDRSSKDEDGNYTLDVYGYDGEWTKIGSANSDTALTIKFYSNFTSNTPNSYQVNLFDSKYVDTASYIGTLNSNYESHLVFSSDQKEISSVASDDSVLDTKTVSLDEEIRTWIGFYDNDTTTGFIYPGAIITKDFYNLANINLYPIFYDCQLKIESKKEGVDDGLFKVEYGSRFTIKGLTASFQDHKGNEQEIDLSDYGYSENILEPNIAYSEVDISLPDLRKGAAFSTNDAILGDLIIS